MIRDSYIASFQNFNIVPTNKFGQNVKFTEMAVISRSAFEPSALITGLRGYSVKIDERDLLDDMTFSVFAPTSNCKYSRIMLGPASFVNHDCNPNSKYTGEGEKKLTAIRIETVTNIAPGEEITVSYADIYFGNRNKQCLCSTSFHRVEGECDEVDTEPVVKIIKVDDDVEHELQFIRGDNNVNGELQSDDRQVDGVEGECDEVDTEPVVDGEQHAVVGAAESEYNTDSQTASCVSKSGKRVKELKMDAMEECLICYTHVKRIKIHLAIHQNIDDADVKLLVDFYRTRKAKRAFECHDFKRRFVSVVTHKYKSNSACNSETKVDNCSSRR